MRLNPTYTFRLIMESSAIRPGLSARLSLLVLILSIAALTAGCGTSSEKTVLADQNTAPVSKDGEALPESFTSDLGPLKIPADTSIRVRLLDSISSCTSAPGNKFEAELTSPVKVDGRLAFPRGTRVRGMVATAHPSGRLNDPGFLQLTLDAIQTTDGKWIPVSTTSVSARGKSHKGRDLTFIGGGSAAGALIGGIAGGGKGVAIGAASGAAAGTAGAYATGKKDVVFFAERKLTFRTVDELVMNR